jgi:hypothetical protein
MSVRRKRKQKRLARLKRKSEQGFRGYPLGTVAVYGPTDKFATKLVAGVIVREGSEALLRKWFSEDADALCANMAETSAEPQFSVTMRAAGD